MKGSFNVVCDATNERADSVCADTITRPWTCNVVEDLLADSRFVLFLAPQLFTVLIQSRLIHEICRYNMLPSVVTGYIRFYAGYPVTDSQGLAWGSLCVLDHEPRKWTPQNDLIMRQMVELVRGFMEYCVRTWRCLRTSDGLLPTTVRR